MSHIADQVHGKFKVFTGQLESDGTMGAMSDEVEAWVKAANVSPKSIGVEFLESAGQLILSIGYRDDESPYAVKLQTVRIGKVDSLDPASLAGLEEEMARASGRL